MILLAEDIILSSNDVLFDDIIVEKFTSNNNANCLFLENLSFYFVINLLPDLCSYLIVILSYADSIELIADCNFLTNLPF